RRVLRAIALLGDPDLVIADEPTPGLGRQESDDVLNHLRAVADQGRGVLLITHDISVALRVTDRVVVAREGRTVDEAPVADFTGDGSRLQHPYTRALWNALPGNGFALPGPEGSPC
ncbi:MAG: ABC transporter ATP-binding protein, partial [Actinomycetia bacterium]|nr:ABC transporter ATP-binding protein [Actinomycetes bacterium]